MKLVSAKDTFEKFLTDYNSCTIRYGDMKKQLAEDMVNFISPIRKKASDILANPGYLNDIMRKGAESAGRSAAATMEEVRQSMGLNYFN